MWEFVERDLWSLVLFLWYNLQNRFSGANICEVGHFQLQRIEAWKFSIASHSVFNYPLMITQWANQYFTFNQLCDLCTQIAAKVLFNQKHDFTKTTHKKGVFKAFTKRHICPLKHYKILNCLLYCIKLSEHFSMRPCQTISMNQWSILV